MKSRAPGKLVLSGAYSVLEGAPAVVSAVDRYVYCDSERSAERVTPEVRAALGTSHAPHFDASELRAGDHKLGLGSSAAILVASLACTGPRSGADADQSMRRAIFGTALRAHREAQGGGSGIDVAASTFGGTLIATRAGDGLDLEEVALPSSLIVEAWSSGQAASTADFIGQVMSLRAREPTLYSELLDTLTASARRAADALRSGQADAWIAQINAQREGFIRLGAAAGAEIITGAVSRLAAALDGAEGAVLPSGAGGGDIVLWFGRTPSPERFRVLAHQLGHHLIPLCLHASGAEQLPGATSGS